MVPTGKSVGTFDWLATVFKDHRAYKDEIDRSTRRMYDQGLALVADFMLEDGSRVGDNRLTDFSRGFVDRVCVAVALLLLEQIAMTRAMQCSVPAAASSSAL